MAIKYIINDLKAKTGHTDIINIWISQCHSDRSPMRKGNKRLFPVKPVFSPFSQFPVHWNLKSLYNAFK